MATKRQCEEVDVSRFTVTVAQLAEMFNLSSERIRQLIKLGAFEQEEDGCIPLQRAIINYERLLAHGARWFEL